MIPKRAVFQVTECSLVCDEAKFAALLANLGSWQGARAWFETAIAPDEDRDELRPFSVAVTDSHTSMAIDGRFRRTSIASCVVSQINLTRPKIFLPWYFILYGFLTQTQGTLSAYLRDNEGALTTRILVTYGVVKHASRS